MTIYADAVAKWGVRSQVEMAVEELAECILALRHRVRDRVNDDKVAEEVADVEIMMAQMRHIFGDAPVDAWKTKKLARLRRRINGTLDAKMGELNG